MKKLLTLLVIMALTIDAFAQSPQKMSYQAVIRDAGGLLHANKSVGMKISILQGSEAGTAVYVETQTKTTNINGLVTLEIGGGAIVSGNFTGIDWSSGIFFIKTETDPTGGTNYTITGTSQILSVPYALYAKTAKNADYNDLTNKPALFSGSYIDLINKPFLFSGNYNDLNNKPLLFDGTWTSLTDKPSTLNGYGIKDGMNTSHVANGITSTNINNWNATFAWGNHAGLYRPVSWVPTWSDVIGKPSFATVATSGSYNDLLNLPALNIANWNTAYGWGNHAVAGYLPGTRTIIINGTALDLSDNRSWSVGTVTIITTSSGITGGTITTTGTIGLTGQALALHNLATNGIIARTGTGTVAARTITAGSGIAVSNGNGISGNPVISTSNISSIGDFAHGGVVFWVDDTGEHGLVCAKNDQSIVRWYAGTYLATMARGNGPMSGEMNTAIIIASQGGGDGYIYAARTCAELQMTEASKTYGDWYLPSRQELLLMYNNKATIYATSTANGGWGLASEKYFSSTEFSSNSAWYVDFLNGAEGTDSKSQSFRVRAVRSF